MIIGSTLQFRNAETRNISDILQANNRPQNITSTPQPTNTLSFIDNIRPSISLSPLHTPTRINNNSINMLGSHLDSSGNVEQIGQMSHMEWMESLEPRIREALDSHGNAEHLAHLCGEQRINMVRFTKDSIPITEALNRLSDELAEMANQKGAEFTALSIKNEPFPFVIALFERLCNTEDNIIFIRSGCGQESVFDVPSTFTKTEFFDFLNFTLMPQLIQTYDLSSRELTINDMLYKIGRIFDELH